MSQENLAAQLAAVQAELAQAKSDIHLYKTKETFVRYFNDVHGPGKHFLPPAEVVYQLVRSEVSLTPEGYLKGADIAIKKLKTEHPNLLKDSSEASAVGSDDTPATTAQPQTGQEEWTDEQLVKVFGRSSDARLANTIGLKDQRRYIAMREEAERRNLIGK